MKEAKNVAILMAVGDSAVTRNIPVSRFLSGMPILCHAINNLSGSLFDIVILITRGKIQDDLRTASSSLLRSSQKLFIIEIDSEINWMSSMMKAVEMYKDVLDNVILLDASIPFIQQSSLKKLMSALNTPISSDTHMLPAAVTLGLKLSVEKYLEDILKRSKKRQQKKNNHNSLYYNPVAFQWKIFETYAREKITDYYESLDSGSIITLFLTHGLDITYEEAAEDELFRIESEKDLIEANYLMQKLLRNKMINQGVRMIAPETVFLTPATKIDSGVFIHPYVVFNGAVTIEKGVEIKSFSHLEGVYIEEGAVIGPYARIRPFSRIKKGAKIGNFVEIKESDIGNNVKVTHFSYLGDTIVGIDTNIGAGVVTCNYDGFTKNVTKIGDNVFVGANSTIVAPISIGTESFVAAGSVITKEVPSSSFTISRPKQKIAKNRAKKIKKK